jgi:hypothetical protein
MWRATTQPELGSGSIVAILIVCDRGGFFFGSGMTLAVFCGGASWSLADAGRAQTASKSNAGSIQLAPRLNLIDHAPYLDACSASIHG